MKWISIFLLFFLSCTKDSDNNGIIDSTEKFFCWECTYHTTAYVSGQTATSSIKSTVCNMTELQIRKFEKDNSKTTIHDGGAKTVLKIACVK